MASTSTHTTASAVAIYSKRQRGDGFFRTANAFWTGNFTIHLIDGNRMKNYKIYYIFMHVVCCRRRHHHTAHSRWCNLVFGKSQKYPTRRREREKLCALSESFLFIFVGFNLTQAITWMFLFCTNQLLLFVLVFARQFGSAVWRSILDASSQRNRIDGLSQGWEKKLK